MSCDRARCRGGDPAPRTCRSRCPAAPAGGRGCARDRRGAPCRGRLPRCIASRSERPIISLKVRKPSFAMSSRTSSARKWKSVITSSGWPVKRRRSSGILRRDTDGTGIEMALAHHHAAGGDERRGGDAEFVGTQERADHHVAARADAAIDLHRDAAAQAVEHQRLVRLGEADLPRLAGVVDRGQAARRRCRPRDRRW